MLVFDIGRIGGIEFPEEPGKDIAHLMKESPLMAGSYQAIRGVVLKHGRIEKMAYIKGISYLHLLFIVFCRQNLFFCCPYRQQKKG